METVFALVPARGGSKALPRKNTKPLAGKPMIEWTIAAARGAATISRTFVSTEDEEIAMIARSAGAETPFRRPSHLATDSATTFAVLHHFMEWCRESGLVPDYIVVLQPTSPLRTSRDIDESVRLAQAKNAEAVIGVTELHPHMAHPWQARRISTDGKIKTYIAGNLAADRRQDLPPAYIINGAIYVYRTSSLHSLRSAIPANAVPFFIPVERSIDVDTDWDFRLADLLLLNPE